MENFRNLVRATEKHPNGMFSEINYEGEKIQIHKRGSIFEYHSQNIEPQLAQKLIHLKKYILQAFPNTKELIIDCEILMIDTNNGKILSPHFIDTRNMKDIHICLLITDCIYCDGDISIKTPNERKEILKKIMTEIQNFVLLSEVKEIRHLKDLDEIKAKVINLDLRGLILKDFSGVCTPGKPLCLKIARSPFLFNDTAFTLELIILGNRCVSMKKKGRIMQALLIARYDVKGNCFRTVSDIAIDHENKFFKGLQDSMNMVKINFDSSKIPNWLRRTKDVLSDIVPENPITPPSKVSGNEVVKDNVDSANETSLRYPVVINIENNKTLNTNADAGPSTTKESDENNLNDSVKNKSVTKIRKNETIKRKLNNANEGKSKKRKINSTAKNPKKPGTEKIIFSIKRYTSNYFQNLNGFLRSKCIKKIKKTEGNGRILNNANEENQENPQKSDANLITEEMEMEMDMEMEEPEEIRPTPNYFTDVCLLLDDKVEGKYNFWIRCFVEYGGKLLHWSHKEFATHVLHLNREEPQDPIIQPMYLKHITVEWIIDTINLGALQDDQKYTIPLAAGPSRNGDVDN